MFFVFKQKTAYEMRISDWSSDVCSSDLVGEQRLVAVIVASLELKGAGGDVDLVVQTMQHTASLQFQVTTVPGFHRQLRPTAVAGKHGIKVVFRQRKDEDRKSVV